MKFSREILETLIRNSRVDHKGMNLYGICPYCGEDEFGISLGDNHQFRCFRGKKCGVTGNIFILLKHLGKMELLGDRDFYRETNIFSKLERRTLSIVEDSRGGEELLDFKPPLGWRRVKQHPYLIKRNFTSTEFDKYEIGTTSLLTKFRDYVIFLIRQGGSIKGYVSRNIKDKAYIDSENSKIKKRNEGKSSDERENLILRYVNSTDTDFSKILYGIDEVEIDKTTTLIIVEGLFDKINLEIIAPTFFSDKQVVVCCTWGKKISKEQINKIIEKGCIKTVILLYDPDAINDSKRYSNELENFIEQVLVGYLQDKDPGDLSTEEFIDVISNLSTPTEFNLNKLQKRELD